MEPSSIAPQKRGLDSPEVWRVSVTCAARRASGGYCGQQQPTDPLRLKGFQHPLAAAAGQLKERQSPKIRPRLGAPLQVPVLGAGAANRTASPAPTHRAAASEAKPRPRKLHIVRSGPSAAAHSFRCSSFSHANRYAGFAWEPCSDLGLSRPKPKAKKVSFPPAAAHFLFQRKWGADPCGGMPHSTPQSGGLPRQVCRHPTVMRRISCGKVPHSRGETQHPRGAPPHSPQSP